MNDGDTWSAVRDVVEPVLGVVGRQQRRGVDVEREQLLDRVRVLGAIQAVQREVAGRRLGGGAVEVGLERCDQAVDLRVAGMLAARRRHQPAAQLADDLLPDLGVRADRVRIELVEREARRLLDGVVALVAVLLDQRPLPLDVVGQLLGRLRPLAARGRDDAWRPPPPFGCRCPPRYAMLPSLVS